MLINIASKQLHLSMTTTLVAQETTRHPRFSTLSPITYQAKKIQSKQCRVKTTLMATEAARILTKLNTQICSHYSSHFRMYALFGGGTTGVCMPFGRLALCRSTSTISWTRLCNWQDLLQKRMIVVWGCKTWWAQASLHRHHYTSMLRWPSKDTMCLHQGCRCSLLPACLCQDQIQRDNELTRTWSDVANGSQCNRFLALVGLPSNNSTSVGLKYLASTLTTTSPFLGPAAHTPTSATPFPCHLHATKNWSAALSK